MPYSKQDDDRALTQLMADIERTPAPPQSTGGAAAFTMATICFFSFLGAFFSIMGFAMLTSSGGNAGAGAAESDPMEDYHSTVWHAICQVESSGNPDAHNPGEDARGIAQVRAIMVEDVNRIVGSDKYSHEDAWCAEKSREMFDIYNGHYHPKGDAERIARCWNGGPRGHKKPATEKYWEKVLDAMKASD